MSFNNFGISRGPNNNNLASNLSSLPVPTAPPKSVGLNAPMISRVYKAKAGCSACGKKVA